MKICIIWFINGGFFVSSLVTFRFFRSKRFTEMFFFSFYHLGKLLQPSRFVICFLLLFLSLLPCFIALDITKIFIKLLTKEMEGKVSLVFFYFFLQKNFNKLIESLALSFFLLQHKHMFDSFQRNIRKTQRNRRMKEVLVL